MIYSATITTSALRVRESRIVADLLLQNDDDAAWHQAVYGNNALQLHSCMSRRRVSALLRARIEPLGQGLWEMVRDGNRELATQATFAGAVNHSRLLGDSSTSLADMPNSLACVPRRSNSHVRYESTSSSHFWAVRTTPISVAQRSPSLDTP